MALGTRHAVHPVHDQDIPSHRSIEQDVVRASISRSEHHSVRVRLCATFPQQRP